MKTEIFGKSTPKQMKMVSKSVQLYVTYTSVVTKGSFLHEMAGEKCRFLCIFTRRIDRPG